MESILILGRQPELGIAEAESLFGAGSVSPIFAGAPQTGHTNQSSQTKNNIPHAALLHIAAQDVRFEGLGGSLKLGTIIGHLDSNNWGEIEKSLAKIILKLVMDMPEGKVRLGLSVYGLPVRLDRLNATGLSLKKAVKAAGHSVRVVPNKESNLNTAQVLHNQLNGPTGLELLLIASGSKVLIARSVAVQDIEAYTKRDRGRPMRDAKVGMLPPKLAQIMLNLGMGSKIDSSTNTNTYSSADTNTSARRLLDPFCGTGVVLQEAALMGHSVYGTDLEERMIRYSRDNLNWLQESHNINFDWFLEVADATSHLWQKPFDVVVCETYLGRPLASVPDSGTLEKTVRYCNELHRKFLNNLAGQLPIGTRLCLAVPAWQLRPGVFKHLPVLDQIAQLGYNRLSFVHTGTRDLIYARPDQVVARELVILEKH